MQQRPETKEDYQKRINIIVEYINKHLGEDIDLNTLAEIAGFSPYHFHRIVKAFLGESIGAFILRKRVETAAHLLRHSDMPVQDIAWHVGYEMPSSLSKAFKQFYNISPNEYRNNKNYTIMRPVSINPELKLKGPKITEQPERKAIYIHTIGNYMDIDYCGTWNRLWAYVKEQKLFTAGIEHICMCYGDPKVTEPDKLSTDICLVIHKPVEAKGEIGIKEIEGGKYAVFTHYGPFSNLPSAFDTIYSKWLPESGYRLRKIPGFEKYFSDPEKVAPEKLKTEIYIPVE